MQTKPALAALSAALIFSAGCAMRPGTTTRGNLTSAVQPQRMVQLSAQNNRITANNITRMLSACENIYAAAGRGNLTACGNLAAGLRAQWNQSKNIMLAPLVQAGRSNAVDSAMDQLSAAIAKGNAYSTQKSSNKVFQQLCNISSTYDPSKTAGVNTVKYYAREIALACQKNDLSAARSNCAQLVRNWNGVKAAANDPATQRLVNSVNRSVNDGNLRQTSAYCDSLNGTASSLVGSMLARKA